MRSRTANWFLCKIRYLSNSMDIKIQNIATTYCPIEGWKETDNCLRCRFFGGLHIYPTKNGIGVSLVCNKPDNINDRIEP